MNSIRVISGFLAAALLSGCASSRQPAGSKGPKIMGSGHSTESGQYAEVGVEFSSWGDMVAIVSPNRWKSPIATGGSLSWLNPAAWSDDAGRTGRILAGEAVIVGGIAIAAVSENDDGTGSTYTASPTPPPPRDTGDAPPGGGAPPGAL